MSRNSSQWPRVAVSEICESIVDCINKTAPACTRSTPFKMIRTTNVKGGWIDLSDVKCVDENVYRKWTRRQIPSRGDVILTREAPLGEVGLLRTDERVFLGQRLVSFRADSSKLDNHFLLYAFLERDLQAQIKALGSGATVEHMRVPDAERLTLRLPPLSIQQKIGAILSTYDDLFGNNVQRIIILEEMARALYREWFMHFRFPGHNELKIVDSNIGKIPSGWQVKRFSEVACINPTERVRKETEKAYVGMEGVSTHSMVINVTKMRTGNSGSKFKNGDTLFARITPCLENGKTGFVNFLPSDNAVGIGSTEFIVLRSRSLCPEYVYFLAREDDFRGLAIKSMSGTSGRQRVDVKCFDRYFIAQPDSDTLRKFSAIVAPMFKHIYILSKRNEILCQSRDLLLPGLVSGELDVSDIAVDTGSTVR
jgi:type I restriction enzyme S subunit